MWQFFTEYTNVLFSEQDLSLEDLHNSLCEGVLCFAASAVICPAKKTSPDTFCPSQAKLSQTSARKIRGFKPILWPFCYLHLEPAWNLMCYSFINAVTWAGLQLDKESSGVKAPAQVWSCCLCHPLTLCCPGVMNPSSGVITPENSLSTLSQKLHVTAPVWKLWKAQENLPGFFSEGFGAVRLLSALLYMGYCDGNCSKLWFSGVLWAGTRSRTERGVYPELLLFFCCLLSNLFHNKGFLGLGVLCVLILVIWFKYSDDSFSLQRAESAM